VTTVILGRGGKIDPISSPDRRPFHHRLLGAVAVPNATASGAPNKSDVPSYGIGMPLLLRRRIGKWPGIGGSVCSRGGLRDGLPSAPGSERWGHRRAIRRGDKRPAVASPTRHRDVTGDRVFGTDVSGRRTVRIRALIDPYDLA
jgi:hypothetical protein